MELYKNIRNRRIELGLTQAELAKKIGYRSISTIAKIERGINDIPQSKIKAFADALNTTPGELMGEVEPAPVPLSLTQQEETHIKKYRQLDADGKEEIDDLIDVKLAKLQRKAEEDAESLG
ncbi:helix-turn-helix domain-containing protein [Phascolarctobacterium succinatutens]|jgi:transcriptional regulator with XRE-family HTH domain|uniref:helix-turn-helix domain-containing protein n=1 Tax=Phascolarctobacterium succinatutens TaxID=626940 RepID=UPI0020470ECD|nr:helix-turn-helix transcriptional regulator [Phascolarctobacterium succinatutens]DAU03062.1 MAG TPA: Helix-turn-helix XRE-family like protein [Caudoviricetes sp.]